jgi:hypothetical protein
MNRRKFLESGIAAAAAAASMTRIPALQIAHEKGNSERFILQAKGLAIFGVDSSTPNRSQVSSGDTKSWKSRFVRR